MKQKHRIMDAGEHSSESYVPYRKHSSGDLQSRLKTRKILGVGETDNGDIHRSKISQVLGHNEHLFIRFPRYYALWYFTMAIMCTGIGLANLFLPCGSEPSSETNVPKADSSNIADKYYGSILLGFSTLLWSLRGATDKAMARSLMLAMGIAQCLQFGILCSHSWQNETWCEKTKWQLAIHYILAAGNIYYFWAIGSSTAGLRKSASYKDLRELAENHICSECRKDEQQRELKKDE